MKDENPYLNPERTGFSFQERIGPPDEITSALGHLVQNFSRVEFEIQCGISALAGLEKEVAGILTAELSFISRVHVLGALIRRNPNHPALNPWLPTALESWAELERQCFRAAEIRNTLVHSVWHGDGNEIPVRAFHRRESVRGKKGYRSVESEVSAAEILDAADFLSGLSGYIGEFFA